jgi:hypothetical protein
LRKAKGEPKRPTLPSHVICISPSPDDMRNVIATLPRAERRRIAAMVRQHRAAAFAASRQR